MSLVSIDHRFLHALVKAAGGKVTIRYEDVAGSPSSYRVFEFRDPYGRTVEFSILEPEGDDASPVG